MVKQLARERLHVHFPTTLRRHLLALARFHQAHHEVHEAHVGLTHIEGHNRLLWHGTVARNNRLFHDHRRSRMPSSSIITSSTRSRAFWRSCNCTVPSTFVRLNSLSTCCSSSSVFLLKRRRISRNRTIHVST